MAKASASFLLDHPSWHYVLQEFYLAYRFGPAGGSADIRRHQREVQTRLSRCLNGEPRLVAQTAETKPVVNHLGRALDNGQNDRMASFIRALAKITDDLSWQYGYDRMPRSLEKKYAYSELLGPRGPVQCDDLILGLVLFSPKCTYPAHSHEDITESYLCLSGYVSENQAGVYPPGSLILNQAGREHAITTSDREPVLLAYAWTGPPEALQGFKMAFSQGKVTTGRRPAKPAE
jgi:dimethylpropiothetin dethiomethylase